MALGMELMLKSLGIDAEKVNLAIANVGQIAVEANERLKDIQAKQAEILKLLQSKQEGAKND